LSSKNRIPVGKRKRVASIVTLFLFALSLGLEVKPQQQDMGFYMFCIDS